MKFKKLEKLKLRNYQLDSCYTYYRCYFICQVLENGFEWNES
jgi:hypothetical protein